MFCNNSQSGYLRPKSITSVSRSKSITSWRLPRNKSATSPQHKQQVHNKSVTSWHGQKSVVNVVLYHFWHSITTTCCQEVGKTLTASPSAGKLRGNTCNGFWALLLIKFLNLHCVSFFETQCTFLFDCTTRSTIGSWHHMCWLSICNAVHCGAQGRQLVVRIVQPQNTVKETNNKIVSQSELSQKHSWHSLRTESTMQHMWISVLPLTRSVILLPGYSCSDLALLLRS